MNMRITNSSILIVLVLSIHSSSCKPQDVLIWSEFDLQFPSDAVKQTALEHKFKTSEIPPRNFDVWRDKLFFTLDTDPRKFPISFGFVNLKDVGKTGSPKLFGYPEGDAKQFEFRKPFNYKVTRVIKVDVCDRLWVIEDLVDGKIQSQITIYDLMTDRLIRKHTIPVDGFFESINVDVTKGNCDETYAYISERRFLTDDSLTVYNFKEDASFRTSFNLRPAKNQTLPSGCKPRDFHSNVNRNVKIDHTTIVLIQADGYRSLYFKDLDKNEYVTPLKALQTKPEISTAYQHEISGCRGHGFGFTFSSIFDENTMILFQAKFDGITCWNVSKHFNNLSDKTTGVYELKERLDGDLKLTVDGNGNLWILYNPFQHETFPNKISKVPITEVVHGTVCQASNK